METKNWDTLFRCIIWGTELTLSICVPWHALLVPAPYCQIQVNSSVHSIPHSQQQRTKDLSLRSLILGKLLISFSRAAGSLVSTSPHDVNYRPAHRSLPLRDADVGITAGQPETWWSDRNNIIHLTTFLSLNSSSAIYLRTLDPPYKKRMPKALPRSRQSSAWLQG